MRSRDRILGAAAAVITSMGVGMLALSVYLRGGAIEPAVRRVNAELRAETPVVPKIAPGGAVDLSALRFVCPVHGEQPWPFQVRDHDRVTTFCPVCLRNLLDIARVYRVSPESREGGAVTPASEREDVREGGSATD